MKLKNIIYVPILAAGIFLGWLIFGNRVAEQVSENEPQPQTWTCSMHPQIRQDHPGKCPICAMDLIP
ncbi:MAG: efflux RND transporter periplasmic adaptor subunit, partial [Dysgonamonadaceae bacterium]|nr:efflux RND transporter periplasmic adaptor subunit [Dysgonamonadaceae bacterium]